MMPLSFPNFKRKFEGILMGVLKKRIIKQKVNGGSAKQIAELGGHITSQDAGITELKFVRLELTLLRNLDLNLEMIYHKYLKNLEL